MIEIVIVIYSSWCHTTSGVTRETSFRHETVRDTEDYIHTSRDMKSKQKHFIYNYHFAPIAIVITSQRGSAWHCYKVRLISKWKMRFWIFRAGKTNEYLEPNLADVITSKRSTNITVCDSFSPFFLFIRFLGQPTGRNFGPLHA